MDSKLEISLLYDFYGALLPEAQQRAVELYVNDDLSLSEVADIMSISRQGVRDSLARAQKKLLSFEEKLGLLRDYRARERAAADIRAAAGSIRSLTSEPCILAKCKEIIDLIDTINEREEQHGI